MVGHNIKRERSSFKVVPPCFESLENSKKLFVMHIVIELRTGEGPTVECNGMDITVVGDNGENCTKCIVGGISLNNELSTGNIIMIPDLRKEVFLPLVFNRAVRPAEFRPFSHSFLSFIFQLLRTRFVVLSFKQTYNC